MVKTIITPEHDNYNLAIPANYIGKKIEILFYALDELAEEKKAPRKIKLSEKYRGSISKEQGQDLNEHIKQMRSEWSSI
jgi:hypothetical protein